MRPARLLLLHAYLWLPASSERQHLNNAWTSRNTVGSDVRRRAGLAVRVALFGRREDMRACASGGPADRQRVLALSSNEVCPRLHSVQGQGPSATKAPRRIADGRIPGNTPALCKFVTSVKTNLNILHILFRKPHIRNHDNRKCFDNQVLHSRGNASTAIAACD